MSSSTLFIVVLVGLPLLMMLMHRGGHSGMGCGMGHGGHGGQSGHRDRDGAREPDTGDQQKRPLLGPPGTASGTPTPAAREDDRHRDS